MSNENQQLTRRAVLRAAGASIAASAGLVGSAGAAPGCVVTTTRANAYNDCPGSNYVWYVEEGSTGFVNRTCTDRNGDEWLEVTWNCGDTWVVSADDVADSMNCYC